jgi:hypothetical protein
MSGFVGWCDLFVIFDAERFGLVSQSQKIFLVCLWWLGLFFITTDEVDVVVGWFMHTYKTITSRSD